MNVRGVSYDVGRVMGMNWRPVFDPRVVHRELEIIKNDLHCNAVRICGLDIDRLMTAAEDAFGLGLEVWLSPEMWDKSPDETLDYITKAAAAAEQLRRRWPERLVFVVGSELTLFMQGIVPGHNLVERHEATQSILGGRVKAGQAQRAAQRLPGQGERAPSARSSTARSRTPRSSGRRSTGASSTSWASTTTGTRASRTATSRCWSRLRLGKPVVVTEFGCRTYRGSRELGRHGIRRAYDRRIAVPAPDPARWAASSGRDSKGDYVRDEDLQARELTETLAILDGAGVEGAFVMTFVAPIAPYDETPATTSTCQLQPGEELCARQARHDLSRHAVGAERVVPGGGRLLRPVTGCRRDPAREVAGDANFPANTGPAISAAASVLAASACAGRRLAIMHRVLCRATQPPARSRGSPMSNIFEYVPHPHIESRKAAGPPKVAAAVAQVHGPGPIGRLNAKVGLRITLVVGTMWCAYLFTLLALVSAPSAFKTGNSIIIVAWVAQTFLQLVLLPIIIVGQNVQAAAADARSQATYDDAAAVLEEAKQIQAHLEAQDDEIEKIMEALTTTKAV